ncbi:MAG: glucose-6-phosphate isomerase [Proteobacteria bacterium]|nr:glucose-6-phosphate isomerase [Pseudomonadota bacterium]
MEASALWNKYRSNLFFDHRVGFALDISRMNFPTSFFSAMEPKVQEAFKAMQRLVRGDIANPDEHRMVGHYWLRNPELAPDAQVKSEIETAVARMNTFAADVHNGKIAPPGGGKYRHLLLVGIGGSALGPQFVNQALSSPTDPLDLYCFDNTDPDGMEQVLGAIPDLSKTLCIVISKSGGTKETRNGQIVAKAAWQRAGLDFSKSCIAVTMAGSELDKTATAEGWLARFPMWDWVGGRTSELSAVGLLAAALQGFNIDQILAGAKEMDELTASEVTAQNPAALMALMWHYVGSGKGLKDMVVLPYKDRLELFSRYLQQLVMESLGKELDLSGAVVNQGIAVYGNKGSTDQHAYVQQLREGLNNFFVVFIEVLKDRNALPSASSPRHSARDVEVEPGVYSGDYLSGFFLGTRAALYEKNRESVTITINEVSARSVGQLIALFERAVGLYALLVNINAYHQPGVEAGKKAAAQVLALQQKVVSHLQSSQQFASVGEIAAAIKEEQHIETIFKVLWRLSANGRISVEHGDSLFENRYGFAPR